MPLPNTECVALLDAVLDMAVQGTVKSVAVVMVTEPGVFRIAAAGNDTAGMLAGARKMVAELEALVPKPKPELIKTVIHK